MPTKEQGRAKVRRLVDRFRSRLRELHSSATSEAVIRQEFLDPFWEALGWDVRNRANRPAGEKDVLIEAGVDTIEDRRFRHKRCDYFFRVAGTPRFLLEAKKPAVETDDPDAIFQAKTYAWNAKIPFAVLSNFAAFRLFDSTVTPSRAHPTRGIIRDFKLGFEDYADKWDALWDTFSREAVEAGSLDRLFAKEKKVRAGRRVRSADRMLFDIRGTAQVDQVFLAHLEDYRERFAKALFRENRRAFPDADTIHGAANLTEAAQRLLDRLVFIRVCEDRDIMPYGRLLKLLEDCKPPEMYPRLVEVFRELDAKYNGYLFKAHPLSEALDVDGTLLSGFIRTLYTPEGPYCFDRIGDDILGIVYERFLGSVIEVEGSRVTATPKPEVRHAGGVYYTPRFVVDSIIRRVIGPKVKGKSPKEVLKVKILDPACGSGSFLIAALDFLMDHCRQYVAEHADAAVDTINRRRRRIAFQDDSGEWHLSPFFRSQLLTNCIHGVDKDQQAVEVTVMSLYIKMLEGQFPPGWQQDFLNQQLLPRLDDNIHCGNSLIDPEELADHLDDREGPLFSGFDEDTQFRINPFDWRSPTHGFGSVFDKSEGFDCIIGNPPYIRVQELNRWAPQEVVFYKNRYQSCARGNFDIYIAFLERGLELLAPKGLLGYICPHKFWQASYGKGIRELIAQGRHLRSVVNFGDQQVFEGASTYTAIHVLSKNANRGSVDYARVVELTDGPAQCTALDAGKTPEGTERFKAALVATSGSWTFADAESAGRMDAVRQQGPPLGECAEKLFVGLQTSADSVFILERSGRRFFSRCLELEVDLEPDFLHPMLKGSLHMKRWIPDETPLVVLFPYEPHGDSWRLIPERDYKARAPKTWDYMLKCREKLRERERGTFEGARWYGYVYPKNLALMSRPKILTPAMARQGEFGLDEDGSMYFVGSGGGGGGGYGILPPPGVDPHYLIGLLNSNLLEWFLKQISTPFRGGWFAFNKQYIEQLPIKLPRTAAEKRTAERIAAGARAITQAKQRLRAGNVGDHQRQRLEREIEAQEAQINRQVNQLYGVKTRA